MTNQKASLRKLLTNPVLLNIILVLVLLHLVFGGLYLARSFLVPLTVAAFLAMLLVPVSNGLQKIGSPRVLASFICSFIVLVFFASMGIVMGYQISRVAQDSEKIEQKVSQKVQEARNYIQQQYGLSRQEQKQVTGGDASLVSSVFKKAQGLLSNTFAMLSDLLLIVVYVFLFVHYRNHISTFVQKLVKPPYRQGAANTLVQASKVARKYLYGRLIIILILWGAYYLGFALTGLKYAMFLSFTAAFLSIIPYLGNIIGGGAAILFALINNPGASTALLVLTVLTVAQLLESYLLTPLIMGEEIKINAMFTIVGIILGGALWGIPGLILAVPAIGILKVLFDNLEVLNPWSFLISDTGEGGTLSGIFKKK